MSLPQRYDGRPVTRGDYITIPLGAEGRRLHPVTGAQQASRARAHMRAAGIRQLPVERWTGTEWRETGVVLVDYPERT